MGKNNVKRACLLLTLFFALLGLAWTATAQSPSIVLISRDTSVSWTAIHTDFVFYWRFPWSLGWNRAEDKTGDVNVRGYKVDVRSGTCARWQFVADIPAVILEQDADTCDGYWLSGGIYRFAISAPTSSPQPTNTPSSFITPTPAPTWAYPTPTAIWYESAILEALEQGTLSILLTERSTPRIFLSENEVLILVDVGDAHDELLTVILDALASREDWQVYVGSDFGGGP